jgi:hypothetical protein
LTEEVKNVRLDTWKIKRRMARLIMMKNVFNKAVEFIEEAPKGK